MLEAVTDVGGAIGDVVDWIGGYERGFLGFLAVLMVALGIFALIDNKTPESPRYLLSNSNPAERMVSNRLAAVMTYPGAFIIPLYCLYISKNATTINTVLVMLMVIHYLQRTFIYGILIKGNSKIPVRVLQMSTTFCTVNGYMIGRYHTEYASYDDHWMTDPRFIIGVCTFFVGMAINIHSDHILRNLRKPGETSYKIPRGGLFEYVTAANYFGEIVEWTGFSIACWTPHSVAFAFFTAGYIGLIKAFAHHRWYLEKFEDYPKHRKVIIPFLL